MVVISTENETEIIDVLMRDMIDGKLKGDMKLPSENQLADQFQVPRMTVRNALNVLEARGYIYSLQGKGRFLKKRTNPIQLHLTGKVSFTDKMIQAGYDLKTEMIACEPISFDEKIYSILNADEHHTIYQLCRLRYIDGEPMAIHNSFVNEAKFPGIGQDGPHVTSMFAYYRDLGYSEFTSNRSLMSISFPTVTEQELLMCNHMVPLIVVESNCIDVETGNMLEYSKINYRSEKFKYDITTND